MEKIVADFEQITFRTAFSNGLYSITEVWWYFCILNLDAAFYASLKIISFAFLVKRKLLLIVHIGQDFFLLL